MLKNWGNLESAAGSEVTAPPVRDSSEVLCLKWKYAIRKGIPCEKIRPYISEILSLSYQRMRQEDYNKVLISVFKGKIPEDFLTVPLFGAQGETLRQAIKMQCLSYEGVRAVSKLMWVINQTDNIQFNPLILHLACILVIFLQEREVYQVLRFLIDDSKNLHLKNQNSLRWHFTFNKAQFVKLSKSFFDELCQISDTVLGIVDHMNRYNINKDLLFEDIVGNFFFKYLPFPFIYKIFMIYMNEGVKIFFRVIYAIFKKWEAQLLKIHEINRMKSFLQENGLMLTRVEINAMLKLGFTLGLNKLHKNMDEYNNLVIQNSVINYYFPCLEGESAILTSQQLETIWGMLPSLYKHYDPLLVFPSPDIGFSLMQLYNTLSRYSTQGVLLVIHSTNNYIFGVFFENNLSAQDPKHPDPHLNSQPSLYKGTPETFLFSLYPQVFQYKPTGNDNCYCRVQQDTLYFGNGGEGPALQVDKDLSKGWSRKSQTFGNQRLHGDQNVEFKIQCIECFVLQ